MSFISKVLGKNTIQDIIKAGKLDKIISIVNRENCDLEDNSGHAPLYYAIKYEKAVIASYLLGLDCNPSLGSSCPEVAVMEEVVKSFNADVLSAFLEHGVQLPATIDGEVPLLHYLVGHNPFPKEIFDLLLSYGLDVDTIDTNTGRTALAHLLGKDDSSMIRTLKVLLESGADVNYAASSDQRPLSVALINQKLPETSIVRQYSFKHVLDLLLKCGLKLDYKLTSRFGNVMPLTIKALQNNRIDNFILLLEKGIPVTEEELEKLTGYLDVNKFSLAQRKRLVAIDEERKLNIPLAINFYSNLSVVVDKVKNADEANDRFTDLVMTTNMKLAEKTNLLDKLLQAGADINSKTTYAGIEMNILTAITSWNDGIDKPLELIEWLLQHGAKIECHGRSAFLWAIWYNKPELVKYFADKGADISFEEEDGTTKFSKVFTNSPSHDQYNNLMERVEMIRLICELCRTHNFPVSFDKAFLDASNGVDLDTKVILPVFVHTCGNGNGEYHLSLTDILIEYGWDINTRFEGFHPYGNILAQLLRTQNVEEDTIVQILDKYPNVQPVYGGEPWDDALVAAIQNGYSVKTIERFIQLTDDINTTIIEEYSKGWIKKEEFNYLSYMLEHCAGLGDDLDLKWVTDVAKLLLEAGIDPNFKNSRELEEEHMQGGGYRKEHTLLEHCINYNGKVEDGYFDVFKLLLDYGADPYQKMCYFEESFLHFFNRCFDSKSVSKGFKYLDELEKRDLLQVDVKLNNGATPLLYAASKGHVSLVRYYVDKGADVHAVGGFDQSFSLHRAISNWNFVSKEDRLETVQILLDAGAEINQIDKDGYSPLMAAAAFGCYTVAQELVKRGANVNLKNDNGETALHYTVLDAYAYDEYPDDEGCDEPNAMNEDLKLKIADLLVKNGADMNVSHAKGGTVLIDAIAYNYSTITEGLIKLKADVNAPDIYGRTPLMIACKFGSSAILNLLGKSKELEKSFLACDSNHDNALHYLASRVYQSNEQFASSRESVALRMLELFMSKFQIPVVKNKQGSSPLHYAAIEGMPDIVGYFIDKANVDVNQVDDNGNSVLIYALSYNEEYVHADNIIQIVNFLIAKGADVNKANAHGQTPLNLVKEKGLTQLADILIEAGAVEGNRIGF